MDDNKNDQYYEHHTFQGTAASHTVHWETNSSFSFASPVLFSVFLQNRTVLISTREQVFLMLQQPLVNCHPYGSHSLDFSGKILTFLHLLLLQLVNISPCHQSPNLNFFVSF